MSSKTTDEGMTLEILDVQDIKKGKLQGGLAISVRIAQKGISKDIPYHIPRHKIKDFDFDALKERARRDFTELREELDLVGRKYELLQKMQGKKHKI